MRDFISVIYADADRGRIITLPFVGLCQLLPYTVTTHIANPYINFTNHIYLPLLYRQPDFSLVGFSVMAKTGV